MMIGVVNDFLEATLALQIQGPDSLSTNRAVIDTGYNGALTLPLSVIMALELNPLAARLVTLGDASQRVLDFYEAEVVWDDKRQTIQVLCVEGEPLIGTSLLKGYKLEIDFVVSRQVVVLTAA